MQFKEKLQELFNQKGCTQVALAKYVGVKPNTVSDWLNKGTSPKINHLYKIVEFFDVSFDYLFSNETTTQITLSHDEKELLSYFRKLPSREKLMELGRLQMLSEHFNSSEKNVI